MRLTGSLCTMVTQGTSGSGTAKVSSADSVRSISRGAGDVTLPMLPPQGGGRTNRPARTAVDTPPQGNRQTDEMGVASSYEHSGSRAVDGCRTRRVRALGRRRTATGRPLDGALHGPVRADHAAGRPERRHRRTAQRVRG